MRFIKYLLPCLGILVLVGLKYFLFISSPKNYNSDIYNYRAFSLINNRSDEHGFTLPVVFQSRLGYEMPLNSYLFVPFFVVFQKFGLSEFAYEIFLTALLGLSIFFLTKSKMTIFFINFCPYFLWPGNWTEKIFVSLTFFAIKFYQSKNIRLLSLASILLLLTTTLALPLYVIYLVTTIFQKNAIKYWKFTIFLLIILCLFLKLFISLPYAKNYLVSQNINITNNIEYKNAVNQLRGEDDHTIFKNASRLLHNKSASFVSVFSYSLRAFDPSLWFFNGDKNISSNRQLVPIFLPLYVLLIFLIPNNLKTLKKIIPGLLIASLFIGLNGEITQSRLLILLPFMILILETAFRNMKPNLKYIFIIISLLSFIPMVGISLDHQPASVLAYSTQSVSELSKIITSNQNKNIFITDEFYPDLGPQLGYSLKVLPIKNTKKVNETYEPYIRSITPNVEIISPYDTRLNIDDPKKITGSIINSIFLVSVSQYQKYSGKDFRTYVPVIYDCLGNPLIYKLNYATPKK